MPASLDRFSAHIDEPTVVTECGWCSAEIYEGVTYYRYEDIDFCDKYCAVNWIISEGAVEVINEY